MKQIDPNELNVDIVNLWANRWLLLTAGTLEDCNMMTVAWGSIGCMWSKPFVQIVVRPQRHTYQFTENSDTFTLCAFPPEFKDDLMTMGTLSGRDGDKLEKTGLTLRESVNVDAPAYNEASLILECRKIYFQDFDPGGFIDSSIQDNYSAGDYHRAYFGEILTALVE